MASLPEGVQLRAFKESGESVVAVFVGLYSCVCIKIKLSKDGPTEFSA